MNWNFLKTEKTAIRITKTYNNIPQPVEYRVDSSTKIQEIIEHIKCHPGTYINDIMKRDQLDEAPTLKVQLINEPLPNNNNITIEANVHYEYNTPKQQPVTSFTLGGLKLISIIAIIFGFLIAFTMLSMQMQHEQNMIDETCYMYLKNGIPDSIEIENTKYNLNVDGTITDLDAVFLNPHHRELLAYQQCIKVNINTEK